MYTFTFFRFHLFVLLRFLYWYFSYMLLENKVCPFFARRRIDFLLISMNLTLCPTFLLSISIWILPIFFLHFFFFALDEQFLCSISFETHPFQLGYFSYFRHQKWRGIMKKKMFVLQRKKFSPCNWKCFLPVFPINFFFQYEMCVCFCASSNFSIGI